MGWRRRIENLGTGAVFLCGAAAAWGGDDRAVPVLLLAIFLAVVTGVGALERRMGAPAAEPEPGPCARRRPQPAEWAKIQGPFPAPVPLDAIAAGLHVDRETAELVVRAWEAVPALMAEAAEMAE